MENNVPRRLAYKTGGCLFIQMAAGLGLFGILGDAQTILSNAP